MPRAGAARTAGVLAPRAARRAGAEAMRRSMLGSGCGGGGEVERSRWACEGCASRRQSNIAGHLSRLADQPGPTRCTQSLSPTPASTPSAPRAGAVMRAPSPHPTLQLRPSPQHQASARACLLLRTSSSSLLCRAWPAAPRPPPRPWPRRRMCGRSWRGTASSTPPRRPGRRCWWACRDRRVVVRATAPQLLRLALRVSRD
jgi:hypothetical protein